MLELMAFEVVLELGHLALGLVAGAFALSKRRAEAAEMDAEDRTHHRLLAASEHGHRTEMEWITHRDKIAHAGAGKGGQAIDDFLAEVEGGSAGSAGKR